MEKMLCPQEEWVQTCFANAVTTIAGRYSIEWIGNKGLML